MRDLAARVTEQRHVPLADAYDGPVLFEGAAAAELFNQLVAGKLTGTRTMVTSPTFAGVAAPRGNDWGDLVGSLVLPRWMSVVDDPTLAAMDGRPVDSYRVDEDGVTTHATTVVDHGMLKTLAHQSDTGDRRRAQHGQPVRRRRAADPRDRDRRQRAPRRRVAAQTDRAGRGAGPPVRCDRARNWPAPGSAGDDPQAMVAIMMGQQDRGRPVVRGMRVAKVYADGHEEPMRGAEISGLSAGSFKEIAAASKTRTVHADAFLSGASILAGGGNGTVTYLMPSLLFANLSIRKPRGTTPKLPVVAPPPP